MPVRSMLALLALVGCNGDTTITKRNDVPVATITAPTDGTEVVEGTVVSLRGTVVDTDDVAEDLVATWFSGSEELCGAMPLAADGSSTCEVEIGLDDTEIILEGRDHDNAAGIASITLNVLASGAPQVEIVTPDGSVPYYSDHDVNLSALVSDAEDDATALALLWTDESGVEVDASSVIDADGNVTGAARFEEGAHALTLTAMDSSGKTGSTTRAFEVGPPNELPGCTIVSPLDGSSAGIGQSVSFTGTVIDPDVAEDWLTATWSSDLDGTLATAAADVNGNVAFDTSALSVGEHVITLTGTDEVGGTCTDEITLVVSAPPSVVIDLPVDGDLYNDGADITFSATVSDDTTASDALTLVWESDIDGVLDTTAADATGLATFSAAWLTTGTHTVTLTAVDENGLSSTASAFFIVNGLPTAPTVEIVPSSPSGDDDLVATVTVDGVDPEADPISYAYAWYVDGVATAYTGDTLPASATTRGEVWEVYVTSNDGYGDGDTGSASATILNSTPTVASASITPDPAYEGDTLTCTAGATADADGDTVSLSYVWTVDGVPASSTTDTLDSSEWTRGQVVVCEITPNDGTVSGTTVSDTLTVANSIPTITGVEITPADPESTDTLTCATIGYADGDGDAEATTYEWTVNGVYAGTGDTLASGFTGGDDVMCTATPFDGLDAGTPMSDTVVIDNTPPVLTDVTLTPVDPAEADILACTPGVTTDVDGTTSFSYTYAWTVNGATIGETSSSLDGSAFDKGDAIACIVTPNDGTDDGLPVTSNVVTAINTAPVVTSVSIAPSSPGTDATLTASVSTYDIDADTVSVTYTWYVNGAVVGGTGATLAGTFFDHGDVVYVEATPNDGTDTGLAVASASVTVANTAPTVTSVTLTPYDPSESSTLTCTPVGSDLDGDAITYTYAWRVNGAPVAATSSTLTGSNFDSGDTVMCIATPDDGAVTGTAMSSNIVTIANTAPELASVTLTPTTAYEQTTLTCSPGASTDIDGDAVTYTYAWYVEGALVASTGTTLTGTYFDRDDDVYCRVTPNDGSSSGAAVSSNTVTISNTAPVISVVTLSPTAPTESSTLTCAPTSSDDDGDSVSYSYAWYVNGSAIGATGSTLTGSSFDNGDAIYCRATPTDGTTAGTAVASNTVTAANTAPVVSSVTLTPTTAYEATTLTCAATASDADGDAISYTYAWTVDGAPVAATGATLTGTYFDKLDAVYCSVTPDDGSSSGTAMASNMVTVSNTAPVMSSVTIAPTTATVATTFTCAGASSDDDGDAVTYSYAWYVNGTSVATSTTLTSTYFGSGDTVYCRATPNDGTTSGTAMSSASVTVANTAPVVSVVTLTPTSPTESSTLTCAPTSSDADGDAVTYDYAWYVNGSAIAPTSATLTGTYFDNGDSVYCRVTPDDGTDLGTAVSSNTVTVSNTAPVVSSVTLTPTTAYEATTLTCSPTASDADGDAISYTYAWTVDGATVAATGATLTGTWFDKLDGVYCSVTPNDGSSSGTAVASNTVTVSNTAPEMSTVTISPTTATVATTFTCSGTSSDDDGDAVTYSYAWYVNGTSVATSTTLTSTYFGSGDTVYCRATPNDGTTSGTAMSSSSVTVANTAPVVSSVTLTPTSPTESSTLTCSPTASDADGDTLSYAYAWYVNGSAIAPTSSTLTGTYFDANDSVYCRVTPNDGTTTGTAVSSNTVTVGNTAPVVSTVTLTPTTAYEASTLTCSPTASDADGDALTYTTAWYVNGALIAPTSTTLTGTYFSRGNTVYCQVTPNDGTTSGTAVASNTVTISNTAPVTSSVSLTPTTATVASTFTCSPTSTDADSDAITHTYAWYVNGSAVAATSSTLTSTYFGGGDSVYCRATATDGTTAGTAVASNTVTVANTAPVVSSVSLTPTSPTTSSTLTCSPTGSDADGDSITYSYAWYVNGSLASGSASTRSASDLASGNTVYCQATPNDGTVSGTAVASNTVTITNTAPVVSSVTLTPTTAYESSTLTCSPTATDADGDAISYTYAWYVNGALIAPTSSTLSGTYFNRTNTVYCRVTPSDGSASGTAVSSNTVTIGNTAPVASSVSLTPTTAYEASTLTCTPTATDADGDSISYAYAWYVNGSLIAPTTSTLTGTYFSRSNTVYCRVTPSDSSGAGTAATSNTVTIGNTSPVLSSVTLTPSTAYETSTLTCAPSATDADGESISYAYAWYVNSALIAPTTSTLTGTYFSRGNTVYCRVTPSDASGAGTAMSSSTVTISNSAPTAPVVTISPEAPAEGVDDILCSVSTASTDADGDAISYTITWTADGLSYPSAFSGTTGPDTTTRTNDTIPFADTDLATTWTCTVTPNDGTVNGTAGTDSVNTVNVGCGGVPTGPVCSGETIQVGYLPGWGATYNSTSSLEFADIMTNDLTMGSCEIVFTNVASGYTLATLAAYDVIVLSDAAGAPRNYSSGEATAIRDYLEGGYGGAYASYLFFFGTADNTEVADLFGLDPAQIVVGATAIGAGATVVDSSHPVTNGLPATFTMNGYTYEQSNTGGWTTDDLSTCADFVIDASGEASVIVNDEYNWRSVYATSMLEYNTPNTTTRQLIYNSILWAAGYE